MLPVTLIQASPQLVAAHTLLPAVATALHWLEGRPMPYISPGWYISLFSSQCHGACALVHLLQLLRGAQTPTPPHW